MKINDFFNEEKTRLDPACWTGKKIGTPKTKVKGGVRVNNCVTEDAVTDFVTRGGQIQQGKLHKPRKGETWQGSSHIGAAGGTGTKGTVSGKAANTNPKSGKPVVTAEQWEPVKKEQGVAEGSLNELSSDLLKRSAQAATDKRNQAMDPELHNALGGGYMNPLATHYDNVSQKMDNRAAQVRKKETIQKIASKIASPAVMRKIGMSGVAEGLLNELDMFAPVTTYVRLANGEYVAASWRRNQDLSGGNNASFIDIKPLAPNVAKQLGLDKRLNDPDKNQNSTASIASGGGVQSGMPFSDKTIEVVDIMDKKFAKDMGVPDAVFGKIAQWSQQQGVAEELSIKHQRDHSTQHYPDTSNSLATRSVSQAELPNVYKTADGHPTVRGRFHGKAAQTRVNPTITPTSVNRKDSSGPIPAFLKKKAGVTEDAVTDFVTRGGQIQQGKLHKPRKGETWQGSSHIGAAGGTGTKGTVSGKAANTNPKSGKPVVTAEQWEPVKKEQGVAEGSLNELSSDLLKRSAQAATDKRNQAMDPELHNALGGGYMNPLATHYDNVSQKMDNRAAQVRKKETIQKIASKIASPAVMRKIGMSGVAEGLLNELDMFAPVTTYVRLANGEYVAASWRRNQDLSGGNNASFIDIKPLAPNVAKQLGLDKRLNDPDKNQNSTASIASGGGVQSGMPFSDKTIEVVDIMDKKFAKDMGVPDAVFGKIAQWSQQQGVAEELSIKHQRDHSTQHYPDTSNSLATRSVSQAELPNVYKTADGHPTVRGRFHGKAAQTRVNPTITPTSVNRKDSSGPIPAFLKKGVAEGFNGEYDDEAGMADNNLETLRRAVDGIDNVINTGDNLPEWCQEKIAVAKSMLVTVWDYMRSEEQIEDPEIAEMYEAMQLMAESMAHKHRVSVDLVWESFEALDDHMLYETAAWRRKEGKSAKGGLNAKGVASYRRENPGSKLQTAVTTKPSKLKPGSKAAKRRKSFCARMSGVKGPAKKPNGKPTRKTLALRKWNC